MTKRRLYPAVLILTWVCATLVSCRSSSTLTRLDAELVSLGHPQLGETYTARVYAGHHASTYHTARVVDVRTGDTLTVLVSSALIFSEEDSLMSSADVRVGWTYGFELARVEDVAEPRPLSDLDLLLAVPDSLSPAEQDSARAVLRAMAFAPVPWREEGGPYTYWEVRRIRPLRE